MKKQLLFAFMLASAVCFGQKFPGMALTPPMGWNSWNTFETNINEQLVRDVADKIVSTGLKDAGYTYIVLDDGWMTRERDASGNLVADPAKFPSGMKALAAYVHSKGLKFGLYNCAGDRTCADYPGSRGHEYQDALLYASWDVDFLKYDWCHTGKINAEEAYITMRDALYAAKRPVVFSLCEWGDNQPWNWAKNVGSLWRTSGDIYPCWDCEFSHGSWSSWGVMRIVYMRKDIRQFAGPDHWNDFDMMEVGNGMSQDEDRSHFALWCMLASPLFMGNDLRTVKKETLDILENKEVISVNQDSLGIQGFKFADIDSVEIWAKPLVRDNWAICFLNRSSKPASLAYDWSKQAIADTLAKRSTSFDKTVYKIRDLNKKADIGTTKSVLKSTIPVHGNLLVKLSK